MDTLALMRRRADTSFTYDRLGRMLHTNEPRVPDRRPAPRLFLGYTPSGYIVRFGASMPDGLARRLEEIIVRGLPEGGPPRSVPGPVVAAALAIPAALSAELRATLTAHALITAEEAGPAYRFPETIEPPSGVVHLTAGNRDLVRDPYPWLYDEHADWQPCFVAVQDGAAVSVCFSARLSAGAAEAGVETLPDYRGRGYAVAVTAAWGAAIRTSGRIPFYSTSWDNTASQGVARRLGLIPFGSDMKWW